MRSSRASRASNASVGSTRSSGGGGLPPKRRLSIMQILPGDVGEHSASRRALDFLPDALFVASCAAGWHWLLPEPIKWAWYGAPAAVAAGLLVVSVFSWALYVAVKLGMRVFSFGTRPWPSASTEQGHARTVVDIPHNERLEFMVCRTPVYLLQLCKIFQFGLRVLTRPLVRHMSDETFAGYFEKSLFYEYLVCQEEPLADGRWLYQADFSCLSSVTPFPEFYLTGAVVEFSRQSGPDGAPAGALTLRSITLGPEQLKLLPTNGEAWRLAKLFVACGVSYYTLYARHPRTHFPWDPCNAITKSVLSANHPLRQLLEPHFSFMLALDATVLRHPRTPIKSSAWKPFAANCGPMEMVSKLIAHGNAGYRVQCPPEFDETFPVARGLSALYDEIRAFVDQVLKHVSRGDTFVQRWAKECHANIPGFPGAEEIMHSQAALADVVATTIFEMSVHHSVQHYTLSQLPVEEFPMRLRIPPPIFRDGNAVFADEDVTWKIDALKHRVFDALFVGWAKNPLYDTRLVAVKYAFKSPDLQAAAADFQRKLREVYDGPKSSDEFRRWVPLDSLCASIEF